MRSMTGYSFREVQDNEHYIAIELKSYNNRYLDIKVSPPSHLGGLEPRFREYLSARINRGKVELTLRYRDVEGAVQFSIDKGLARTYAEALRQVAEETNLVGDIRLSDLLEMGELVQTQRVVDVDSAWAAVQPVLEEVFQEYEGSRSREGAHTRGALLDHARALQTALDLFVARRDDLENAIGETVRERFDSILGDRIEEDRVLAEVAALLLRYSIDEEISRLSAHLASFHASLDDGGPIGKRLDFLCQEMNREVNTIGSKSIFLDVNQKVVAAKDAIEKIREQLRNVE